MIVGIGTDIVEVERIQAAMRNPRFVKRVLTDLERSLNLSPQRIAGRWAAKEAVAKAVGKSLSWHDVEIVNNAAGAPQVVVAPGVLPDRVRIHITISHVRTHATAVAIVEIGES